MSDVTPLHRNLEQELAALLRGASLECLVCGEFVLHDGPVIRCPECGVLLHRGVGATRGQLELDAQAG